MIRHLIRELVVTAFWLGAASVATFSALDLSGHRDWFSTDAHASAVGLAADKLGARDLPLLWNSSVRDADDRTRDDLRALGTPALRDAALEHLTRRGSAALPVMLPALTASPPSLAAPVERDVLGLLSRMSPSLSGGDPAPLDRAEAIAYWTRFYQVRSLDFRPNFALRQAARLSRTSSSNAREQISRLGSYSIPALINELGESPDPEGRARLCNALADLTTIPLRPTGSSSRQEINRITEAWKAWWFAEHLEFEQLSTWQRSLAHVHETRYGHWLGRALWGRFGISAVTHRPAALELSERLPVSVLTSGLGGLFALAIVVAFGGGRALRARPLRMRLVDLFGATVPGLLAFIPVYGALLRLCAQRAGGDLPARVFQHTLAMLVGVVIIATAGAFWLRRAPYRVTLHAVRVEAETWAMEGRAPGLRAMVRHGLRVAVASLLAPMGLAAPIVLAASIVIEPLLGIHGMGWLTLRAVLALDAPWLMLATISVVPIFLGRRWARQAMIWALLLDGEPDDLVDHQALPSIGPPAMPAAQHEEPNAVPPGG